MGASLSKQQTAVGWSPALSVSDSLGSNWARIHVMWRWQFLVIIRRLQCHGVQTSQVPIFWEHSNGIRVNANVAVDVVSQQPLKCTKHYRPPHTKVVVRFSSSFLSPLWHPAHWVVMVRCLQKRLHLVAGLSHVHCRHTAREASDRGTWLAKTPEINISSTCVNPCSAWN